MWLIKKNFPIFNGIALLFARVSNGYGFETNLFVTEET